MSILIKLVSDYSAWLYGACAIVALFLLRAAISARRERMQAAFSLEREAARIREYRIMSIAIIVLLVMGGIYSVERFVVPNVDLPYQVAEEPTPASVMLPTITPTPEPPTATPTVTPTIVRPTLQPTQPVATLTPEPTESSSAAPPAHCPDPGIQLTSPGSGATVSGVVQVIGTASISRFQFYKLEMGPGSDPSSWSYLTGQQTPVSNGLLGTWDTGPLPPGVYSLRLVVVDETGNFPTPCKVTVNVAN